MPSSEVPRGADRSAPGTVSCQPQIGPEHASPDHQPPSESVGSSCVHLGLIVSALILSLIGGFAAVLGASDVYSAVGLQYRLLGLLFLVAGAIILTAAFMVVTPAFRRSWGRVSGLVAGALGSSVGGFMFAYQIGYPHTERLVLWSAIFLASMLAAFTIHTLTPRRARSTKPDRKAIGTASALVGLLSSAGVSATLLWGFFQFWYDRNYVPGTLGAAVAVSGDLQEGGSNGGMRAFSVGVKLKNTAGTRVQVMASLFKVTLVSTVAEARNTNDGHFLQTSTQVLGQKPTEDLQGAASRYYHEASTQVVQVGKVLPDRWTFEPGEEYSRSLTVELPADSQGLLRLSVNIVASKGIRVNLAKHPDYGPRIVSPRPYSYVVTEWPLTRLSTIQSLTRGDQAATIVFLLEQAATSPSTSSELPALYVCIDQATRLNDDFALRTDLLCPGNAYQSKLGEYYGLIQAATSYDFPVNSARAVTPSSEARP
jgi:hypothetical protein